MSNEQCNRAERGNITISPVITTLRPLRLRDSAWGNP